MLSENEFLDLNARGLIPGPGETEAQFDARVRYCLSLKQQFQEKMPEEVPFIWEGGGSPEAVREALVKTKTLYGIQPDWVPVFFSNYKLPFWHGGCAWIFQMEEKGPKGAFLQMRKALGRKRTYLFIYDSLELISHELAHVGRMAFEEPRFEELIAYRSSEWKFRRVIGPLFQSAKESLLFLFSLFLVIFFDAAAISFPAPEVFWLYWPVRLIPLGILAWALIRLRMKTKQWNRAKSKLAHFFDDKQKAKDVLFRLTDKEIIEISEMEISDIAQYFKGKQDSELRWKVIRLAYLKD